MAPNKRGGPISGDAAAQALREASVISAAEIAARGSGTSETADSYKGSCRDELRVFLTVIGAIIGAWGGVFYKAAVVLLPASVSAGVSTLATVWLTGCFHEDGLSDCFDGFGGGWGRKQILNIMKDSRVGTYALVGMVLVLHQKLAALAAFDWQLVAPIMIAAHCASRWSSSVLTYCCTYIQDEEDAKKGLYNWFADSQRLLTKSRLAFCTATAVVIPLLMIGLKRTLIVWATLAVVTVASGLYGTAIIGGVVGDYLGATIQVAELCIYLALLADWSVLFDGSGAWKQIAALLATIALPVIYTRKIVDFGAKKS